MRKMLHIILSQLLLVAVTVSMMGVPMKKMECLISGKARVGLYVLDACCASTTSTGATIYGDCCAFSSELFQLNSPVVQPGADAQQLLAIQQAPIASISTFEAPVLVLQTTTFADLPPPIPGSARCALNQVFRI